MTRFALLACALAGLLTGPIPLAAAQDVTRLKQEYARFAHLYSMEWGSAITQEYLQRSAIRRADLLAAQSPADPALRKAGREFQEIAWRYVWAWHLRNSTRMTDEEFGKKLKALRQIPEKSDDEIFQMLRKELKVAQKKEEKIWEAGKQAFKTRGMHGSSWKEVLPLAKKLAGPQGDRFPLRLGLMYLLNTSTEALTHVTVAIETNSCVEMPGQGRLHVVFFERLDPGDWVSLPPWLVNRQWQVNRYVAGTDILRCSVWCDQTSVENVGFDLRPVPGGEGFGLFPDKTFAGSYDTTTPWTTPPIPTRNLSITVAGGIWKGKDNATGAPRQLVIMEFIGGNFIAIDMEMASKSTRIVEGRIQDGKMAWEPMVVNQGQFGDPHWGTITAGRMELSYGKKRTADGTVSLVFSARSGEPATRFPPGPDVIKKSDPPPTGASADAFQANSVWVNPGQQMTFTVLERQGEKFKARFEIARVINRVVTGEIRDGRISWLARDVQAIRGGSGGDNYGTVSPSGDRIDFQYRTSNGNRGAFTLYLQVR